MKVAELNIEVEYKAIKNMHLTVYPPDGRIRISVPKDTKEDEVSLLLYSRLDWLRSKVAEVQTQERQSEREFVSGENHYLFGERYLLKVIPSNIVPPSIKVGTKVMELFVRPGATISDKQKTMEAFYRNRLRSALNSIVPKWADRLDEAPATFDFTIMIMQKQWGSCITSKRKILFNLLLARVPLRCIEYIVVHELCHLKVHQHNKEFAALLNKVMPDWSARKKELDEFLALPFKD